MRLTTSSIVLITLLLMALPAMAQIHDTRALVVDPTKAERPIAPMLDGLVDYIFPVTTKSLDSQKFFEQGATADLCLQPHRSTSCLQGGGERLDPGNAMAYWG